MGGYEALARDARINLVDISTNSENNFVPTKQSIEAAIEKAGKDVPGRGSQINDYQYAA